MPAPRVSAKLSGGPRGQPHRWTQGSNEIDPNNIGNITLNRDAIQALTIAQAKVQVTISAGGTTAILVSEKTGEQIGGLDDLAKLLGLRAFVAKEKKATASSALQDEILVAAYRASVQAKTLDPTFIQKKLDNSFVLAARPYKALASSMEEKLRNLNDNYHEGSAEYKDILRSYCSRISEAAGKVVTEMVKGQKEKGLMESFLLELGVPSYVRNKLQLKSLAITKDMDLSRVLFPQDPSKGLSLTLTEWRADGFVEKQGMLLKSSEGLIKILRNDTLVLELVGMSKQDFSNAEDPRAQRVLKTRILVVPPFTDHKRVLEPLSRSNFRGFGLPSTAMDQSKDRLANLCAVFIRAYAFSIRMAETITDFFDQITPKGTIRAPDDKRGNYAKQMLDALEKGTACDLTQILMLDKTPDKLMAWICRECKIIPDGDLYKKIKVALHKVQPDPDDPPASVLAPSKLIVSAITVDMVSPIVTGAEKDAFKSFRSDVLSLKDKTVKGKKTMASTVLSRGAKIFLKNVAREHNHVLAQSMEAYFRGFYSEAIQAAAVRIAEARFDDLDDLSEVGSSADDTSDEEKDPQ